MKRNMYKADHTDSGEDRDSSRSSNSRSSTETLHGGPLESSTEVNLSSHSQPTAESGPHAELSEFLILHPPRPDQRDSTDSLLDAGEASGYSGDGEHAGHSGYEASGEGSSASELHSAGPSRSSCCRERNNQDEAGPSVPNRDTWASRFSVHSSSPEEPFTWRRHRQGVGHASYIPVNVDSDEDMRYRRYVRAREWTTPSTTDAEGAGEPGRPRYELPRHLIRPDATTAEELGLDMSQDEYSPDEGDWYLDHGDDEDEMDEGENMEEAGQDIDVMGDDDDVEEILLLGPRSSTSSDEDL